MIHISPDRPSLGIAESYVERVDRVSWPSRESDEATAPLRETRRLRAPERDVRLAHAAGLRERRRGLRALARGAARWLPAQLPTDSNIVVSQAPFGDVPSHHEASTGLLPMDVGRVHQGLRRPAGGDRAMDCDARGR